MSHAFQTGDIDLKPNALTLGTVLKVWAANDHPDAPERVTSLVRWAEAESKDGIHQSSPTTFVTPCSLIYGANQAETTLLSDYTKS
jgi:hypothetical protein